MKSSLARRHQVGAAALIVVMVLFFIASMVAAYASRNMIFEQRTGTNLFRATQALEAAEAGMDWAITMLNQGRSKATPSAPTRAMVSVTATAGMTAFLPEKRAATTRPTRAASTKTAWPAPRPPTTASASAI